MDDALKLKLYRLMTRVRRFEETAVELFQAGQIPGFMHSSLGQEAVAVGVCSVLRKDDYITSTHRGHGHVLAKGADPKRMMAELFGRSTGYCKGKGGSMHIADFSAGVIGANGIVGAGLPIAGGAALSAKMQGKDYVTVCFFGDGAANQGSFHEALNLASIWELPVVYVCSNNLYAMSTPQSYHMRIKNIADRAVAYGFPGVVVDGNDITVVRETASAAVDRARAGGGPTLIECKTYRKLGHYVGDPATYRPADEVERWMERDPLVRFAGELKSEGVGGEELSAIWEEALKEVEEAVAYAKSSPSPAPEESLEDLYVDRVEVPHL